MESWIMVIIAAVAFPIAASTAWFVIGKMKSESPETPLQHGVGPCDQDGRQPISR